MTFLSSRRSFFVPEVIQTSLTDCGPAALKAMLHGLGIDVNYEWLRARCQTDVDGTSLDALASLGRELGIATSQILTARDTMLLPEADCLPAIVPTHSSGGATHFVVLWNTVGPYVQVMDPRGGRRWIHRDALLASIPLYRLPMSKARWNQWVASTDALRPLDAKLRRIGLDRVQRAALLEPVRTRRRWMPFAKLDAAVRMVSTLVRAKAIGPGREAANILDLLIAQTGDEQLYDVIPQGFWWALPGRSSDELELYGTVLVHFEASPVLARTSDGANEARATFMDRNVVTPEAARLQRAPAAREAPSMEASRLDTALPNAIATELAGAHVSPLRLLLRTVQFDAPKALPVLLLAATLASLIAVVDVVLLRGILDVTTYLTLRYQRVAGIGTLLVFVVAALAFELYVGTLLARVGRGLETRLRIALLEKLPRFQDAYLRSRPTSDMASRAHALHMIRQAPPFASRIVSASASYVSTVLAFAWLEPALLAAALCAAGLGLVFPYLIRKPLTESMMRLWTQAGALDRFYLDALTGAVPMRAHGAELALRREHESLLVEWSRTAKLVLAQTTWTRAIQSTVATAIVTALVASYVLSSSTPARLLLIAFLALRLPALGEELATQIIASHEILNVAHRLFAPLGGKEEISHHQPGELAPELRADGVAITMRSVTVQATGHTLLRAINLDVKPGEHIAIVGASGAGKSSLVSILLGWLEASEGEVLVDGRPLDVGALRRVLVWVDPQVALWNQSLLDNVTFGTPDHALDGIASVVDAANLSELVERLPEGLQTTLGESGSRLSGGEGQRVRLARALLRKDVRLVILDEAFRGLERDQRRRLMDRVRRAWPGATILNVSHDVSDTLAFDRVLVIDAGSIVEDGIPAALMATPTTRYSALGVADAELRRTVFSGPEWQRIRMESGRLHAAADHGEDVV